ncbi:hypothetical protein [Tautonia plasticadhaerens]|uniref:Right handed beta helix domain-containing protein n=1 Tax=Tautonia plasticadhaerens TaxID=2527974 RepID=A0A518GYC7_9BACT|nr:hypothetical protein [Tautonia plasticadhaerens]QDV33600.1 hypothetical protein ElP_14760 [Tautonia plasticadhaerens]
MRMALLGTAAVVGLGAIGPGRATAAAIDPGPGIQDVPISARWLGQVGTDRVGRSAEPGPNGVQDMVIEISGLPEDAEVERVVVRGQGRDEWNYEGPGGHWAADLERGPASGQARISVEPSHVETGRAFAVALELSGGRRGSATVQGGPADPMARMPEVRLAARWAGPAGVDRAGPGPSVGPDGLEDVRIDLARLAPDPEVTGGTIRVERGPSWSFGPNPEGLNDATLVRPAEDRTRASLILAPVDGIEGKRGLVELSYNNGTKDRVAFEIGSVPVGRRMPRPALPIASESSAGARWLGQDEQGTVRVEVAVGPTRRPRGAVLSDGVSGAWAFDGSGGEPLPFVGDRTRPLGLAEGPRAGTLLLTFSPYRPLDGEELTLRLIDEDGASSIVRVAGGPCDPLRRFQAPRARRIRVGEGQDLGAMARQGGTIVLAPGTHRLDRPLDLMEPTTLLGEPDAELRFRQRAEDAPWGEAVAIRGAGRTSISGIRIRFDGPVRWDPKAHWGGAVVGVPNLGTRPGGPVHVEIRDLDLEAPPASSDWERAPNTIRLIDTDSGAIERCAFKGGEITLFNGPWRISGNRHRGTQPGTFSGSFLSGRSTRDLEILDNEIRPEPGSGKLYRFLALADRGVGVTIRGNMVIGVGPMDDDERPHPNAPEVLLTESYLMRFEGRHAGQSDDGRVLAIPEPQGEHPSVGEVASVLSGPQAGRWSKVVQVLDRNAFLLDPPLPVGEFDVAITPGFVDTVIEGNTIDCRGSTEAHNVVLTGNHYGTRMAENRLFGGANAFRLSGYVSTQPFGYGWSHTPQFGLEVASNSVVDTALGGLIAVHHGPGMKSNRGRVYLTASVSDNTFRWTGGDRPSAGEPPVAMTIGQLPSLDPGELSVTTGRNTALDGRGESLREPMRIRVGTVNGRTYGPSGD